MSKQNAVAFIKKVNEDESVYLEVKKLQPADYDGLLKVAATAGFPFSLDEWKEVLGKAKPSGELSDQQLDNVAGGTLYTSTFSPVLTSFTGGLTAKCFTKCKYTFCSFNTF
jgi:predicted ribosomally synthesized peptide with nif11-like leader